jgi:hypothetical protein
MAEPTPEEGFKPHQPSFVINAIVMCCVGADRRNKGHQKRILGASYMGLI